MYLELVHSLSHSHSQTCEVGRQYIIVPILWMRKLELGRLSGFSNPGSCRDRTGIQALCFPVLPRPLVSALLPPRLRQELRGAPISVADARRKWTASCSWSPCHHESSFHAHSHAQPHMMFLLSCQSFSGCRVLSSLIDQLSIALEKTH